MLQLVLFPTRPRISLPWANEVPPDVSVINIKALKHSLRILELFPSSSLWISAGTPSLLPPFHLSPCAPPYFPRLVMVLAPLGSSLSWDPFDEITLHLGQFSVWWFVLGEPISGTFQKGTGLFIARPNRLDPPRTSTHPLRHLWKWNRMGVGGVICKEDKVNLLF